nr:hypothetical protein BaRGS_031189 [Batillaria attramentaria]
MEHLAEKAIKILNSIMMENVGRDHKDEDVLTEDHSAHLGVALVQEIGGRKLLVGTLISNKKQNTLIANKRQSTLISNKKQNTLIANKRQGTLISNKKQNTLIANKRQGTLISNKGQKKVLPTKRKNMFILLNKQSMFTSTICTKQYKQFITTQGNFAIHKLA